MGQLSMPWWIFLMSMALLAVCTAAVPMGGDGQPSWGFGEDEMPQITLPHHEEKTESSPGAMVLLDLTLPLLGRFRIFRTEKPALFNPFDDGMRRLFVSNYPLNKPLAMKNTVELFDPELPTQIYSTAISNLRQAVTRFLSTDSAKRTSNAPTEDDPALAGAFSEKPLKVAERPASDLPLANAAQASDNSSIQDLAPRSEALISLHYATPTAPLGRVAIVTVRDPRFLPKHEGQRTTLIPSVVFGEDGHRVEIITKVQEDRTVRTVYHVVRLANAVSGKADIKVVRVQKAPESKASDPALQLALQLKSEKIGESAVVQRMDGVDEFVDRVIDRVWTFLKQRAIVSGVGLLGLVFLAVGLYREAGTLLKILSRYIVSLAIATQEALPRRVLDEGRPLFTFVGVKRFAD